MPWSDWVQPDDEVQPPFTRMLAMGDDLNPGLVDALDDAKVWIGSGVQWNAVQFRTDAPTLDPFPYPLYTLTEGVDYAAKPGSDPSDPYRFVEYEAAEAQILGWEWPAWPYPDGGPYIDHTLNSPGSGVASIVAPTDYPDVDTEPFIPGLQGGGFPGEPPSGVPFATFTGAESPGTELADPPDPGPYAAFTVKFKFDAPEPDDDRVYFTIPRNPAATYRPPRFRYWIPGGAPLRLMQRGDDRGMGSGRVYSTGTRQSSTRVFGAP